MSIMQSAFAKARVEGELGEMVAKAAAKAAPRKRNLSKDPLKAYEQRIKRSCGAGIGPLRPCAHLEWRPGSPALANGEFCRIKWGLSDGHEDFVVVLYDHHKVVVTGSDEKSYLGIVPVDQLQPCNCLGYIHTRGCTPQP